MKHIHSLNSITLPFSIEQIWKIIMDIASNSLWWPSSIQIKVLNSTKDIIGSQVEVKPYGSLPFICECSEYVYNDKLVMKYSGIYSGFGVWTLREIYGRTKIDYEINLEIKNLFIRLLSYVVSIEKIHYELINEVLFGLEKRLEGYKPKTSQTKVKQSKIHSLVLHIPIWNENKSATQRDKHHHPIKIH